MAMQVGGDGGDETPISDINTTPLVDVMLVLLIIFLITVPVVLQSIPLQLPKTKFEPTQTKPENVNLSVIEKDGQCAVYWGVEPMGSNALRERAVKHLEKEKERLGELTPDNVPEVHIRGDVNTPYECVGGAIFQMQYAGFTKVGFISEPPPESAR